MGLEIKRPSDIRQKLHPNKKLRAWYASHTFGGTTKTKSLKILGFNKKNFYYIAAAVAVVVVCAGAGIGIGVQHSLKNARVEGASEGQKGEQYIAKITRSRIRTYVSGGVTVESTEVATVDVTSQRGGGLTTIVTTGADGQQVTVPGSLQLVTNTAGELETVTYVGSTAMVTNNDVAEVQTFFGDPTVITSNGQAIETTVYDDVSVVTDQDGQVSTSFDLPDDVAPTREATGAEGSDSAAAPSATDGVSSSTAQPSQSSPSAGAAPSTSAPAATTSTSQASLSSSAVASPSSSSSTAAGGSDGGGGGGGGGEEFEGEATFYAPGLGSCGTDATDNDYVAALSKVLFDATGVANSNANPYCGRKALVKAAGGKRRRWKQVDANSTTGIESWDKSRHERWSRRSMVARAQRDSTFPTPSQNNATNQKRLPDGPPRPGITPAPDPMDDIWKRQAGGGGVTITIVDRCPVCKEYDLDLSPAAYNVLGDPDAGRIAIKWSWLD